MRCIPSTGTLFELTLVFVKVTHAALFTGHEGMKPTHISIN
jgi:hypothetical protein